MLSASNNKRFSVDVVSLRNQFACYNRQTPLVPESVELRAFFEWSSEESSRISRGIRSCVKYVTDIIIQLDVLST